MSFLVTGATGFIGHRLVQRLLQHGCQVHAISRSQPTGRNNGVQWWHGDLADVEALQRLVATIRPRAIIHLAGYVSGDRSLDRALPICQINFLSAAALLVAAAKVGCARVILAGSLEEPDPLDGSLTPSSPYAAAKWAASCFGRMAHALYGLPVVMLRIAMVYGPEQWDHTKLVPYVIQHLLQGKAPALGSGQRAVDWVYIDDVVEAIHRACFADSLGGQTIDIGTGTAVSIREVVERLVRIVNPAILPSFGAIADRALDRCWQADTARGAALLGWRATTSLQAGLEETVRSYRRQFEAQVWRDAVAS